MGDPDVGAAGGAALALPPGTTEQLQELERRDRHAILDLARVHGPVFRAASGSHLVVCVVGLDLARRLLRDHSDALRPVTIDIRSVVPDGFIRQMGGELHQRHRAALGRAIDRSDIMRREQALTAACEAVFAAEAGGTRVATRLADLALETLVDLFFGSDDQPHQRAVLEAYRDLGPFGLAWTLGPRQHQAFTRLRDLLVHHPADADTLLGRTRRNGDLDDTLLGNLIYMVEMARADLAVWFRWMLWHLTDRPDLATRIVDEPERPLDREPSMARAFVLETLRHDQTEQLLRKTISSFDFEGHHIPETATVRLCLWESHRAPRFDDAMSFVPDRFVDDPPSAEQFAPFGLDRHQCPFGALSIDLATVYVHALCRGFEVTRLDDAPPVRGPYHWEPSPRFSVDIRPKVQRR